MERYEKKKNVCVCVFALSSPLLVSRVRGLDKHRRSDLYCSVTSALFLSWSCRSDDSFTFFNESRGKKKTIKTSPRENGARSKCTVFSDVLSPGRQPSSTARSDVLTGRLVACFMK